MVFKKDKGFTLIEIMMIIAILALLAAIGRVLEIDIE